MPGNMVGLLAAVLMCVCGIARADIVYDINISDAVETVTGTITTDGSTGFLAAADFVSWNFTASGPVSLAFSGPPLPAFCPAAGCGIFASDAFLEFAGTGPQLIGFLDSLSAESIVFKPGQIVVHVSDAENAFISQGAPYPIGAAVASVPEPPTAILIGLGLACLGWACTPARGRQIAAV
jgi:hypothetical protein